MKCAPRLSSQHRFRPTASAVRAADKNKRKQPSRLSIYSPPIMPTSSETDAGARHAIAKKAPFRLRIAIQSP
jgi:hypothetical protein